MKWHHAKRQAKRKRDLIGVGLLFFGVFLGFSLFSYNPQDPSFNSLGIDLKVTNYCGYVGAFLSDLFYQLFGMMSWGFVLGSFIFSVRCFKNSFSALSFFANTSLFFIFLSSLSCLAQLYFKDLLFYANSISLGGVLGKILLKGLEPLFHPIGTTVLLWAVLLLSLVFYGQMTFLNWFRFSLREGLENTLIFFVFIKNKGLILLLKITSYTKRVGHKATLRLKNKSFFKRKEVDPIESIVLSEESNVKTLKEENSVEESLEKEEEVTFLTEGATHPLEEKEQKFLKQEVSKKKPSFCSKQSFKNLPPLGFLIDPPSSQKVIGQGQAELLSKKLVTKLSQFSIEGRVTAIKPGPAVTLFEFKPNDNVKVSRIREMGNDISLALSSESIRIIAPIPGRDVVGIEVSNSSRQMVYLKTLVKHPRFRQVKIPLVLGRRADNQICIEDLARLPHLLVAGTTGSGKSIFVINFIVGLLYRYTPEDIKLLLVDPKQVDLSVFKNIPHLLAPPVTSSQKTTQLLRWLCAEMEKRYRSLAQFGVRDLASFNQVVNQFSGKDKKQHEDNQETQSYYYVKLPLICLVIEEFGDLMMDSQIKRSIENYIVRLAQKARASGIHLILAMQSPRKDVITGLIKTNIPGRISFKVSSSTDSRVILDEGGAERLLSQGDMLFLQPGTSKPLRFHGPYISEREVSQVVSFWREEGKPEYEDIFSREEKNRSPLSPSGFELEQDTMYEEIRGFIRTQKVVSASFLQRKFRIGYPRAARIIEILHEKGEIGPSQGSKPREVLINK